MRAVQSPIRNAHVACSRVRCACARATPPCRPCSHYRCLHLPSIKARIAIRKFRFLAKLLKSEQDDLASRVFRTLSADNVYCICLVEQCRWLLEELGLGWILQKCLSDPMASDTVKDLRNIILKQDRSQTVNSARNHPSLKHIVCSNLVAASWCSHWDRALDLGTKGTRLFQCLFSSLCRPVFGDRVCPLCEREIPSQQNYFDHLNSDHLNNVYGLYNSPQKYFRE